MSKIEAGKGVAHKPPRVVKAIPGRTNEVRKHDRTLATVLHVVSDGTRIGILRILNETPTNVGDLCDELSDEMTVMTQPAVSHHLKIMKLSNLVMLTRSGASSIYELTDKGKAMLTLVNAVEV